MANERVTSTKAGGAERGIQFPLIVSLLFRWASRNSGADRDAANSLCEGAQKIVAAANLLKVG